MLEHLDALMLARIQFAFTVSYHILFPAFTIGLASWLAVVEWRWLKTGNEVYRDIYRMWVKIFAVTFGMAMLMAIVVAPVQLLVGDLHGLNTLAHQPVKVSAMEGIWETERGAALKLFGWPDEEAEKTRYTIEIPKLSSLILTHDINGEVKGLKEWPREERPPVAPVFLSLGIFLLNYIGLGISIWPWLVPYAITFRQAAASPESQSLLIVGTILLLPVVLLYTGYAYYIFRGKTSHDAHY